MAVALLTAPVQLGQPDSPRHATNGAYNRALGVECVHCHVQDRWDDDSKPAFSIAANMALMVDAVNDELTSVGFVSCQTCHGGQTRPARQPSEAFAVALAAWPAELADAPEPLKITMSVYNVALGVGCEHCHSADWKARDKDPILKTAVMTSLFDVFPKYMPPNARTQCFMCHKGSTLPQ